MFALVLISYKKNEGLQGHLRSQCGRGTAGSLKTRHTSESYGRYNIAQSTNVGRGGSQRAQRSESGAWWLLSDFAGGRESK